MKSNHQARHLLGLNGFVE
ncbi:ribosome hibernation factor SRA [Klebsiella aerogenes]